MSNQHGPIVKLALPKGSIEKGVFNLLAEAGVHVQAGGRRYRPVISLPEFEAKILRPQDILDMLHLGSRDVGFAGKDWVEELQVDVVELLDTGLDPVRLVAAAPKELLENGRLPNRSLVIASEYERLTKVWIEQQGLDATFVRSSGATEVFPPEDADCIVDNTASGSTLRANDLMIIDTLITSSTRVYASKLAVEDPAKKEHIDRLVMLLRSVLEARRRVMLEVNVSGENLEQLVACLSCMREPTIAPLHGDAGYAVKAAVLRNELPQLIPVIKQNGGSDIVVSAFSQIVP